MPFEVALIDTAQPPIYQRIAAEVLQLFRLGLSSTKIAKALHVSDKTVTKAIDWFRSQIET